MIDDIAWPNGSSLFKHEAGYGNCFGQACRELSVFCYHNDIFLYDIINSVETILAPSNLHDCEILYLDLCHSPTAIIYISVNSLSRGTLI